MTAAGAVRALFWAEGPASTAGGWPDKKSGPSHRGQLPQYWSATRSAAAFPRQAAITRCGAAVAQGQRAKLSVPPDLLAHITPPGWAPILLTGEYKSPKR